MVLILFALCVFALWQPAPKAFGVDPPPDGCYPRLTTAEGCAALFSLSTGEGNTALGHDALFSDTTGSWNTGVGAVALGFNNANWNTAVGAAALLLNTIGGRNTAIGAGAMVYNNTGDSNTAVGSYALLNNTEGSHNVATGHVALFSNTTGHGNVATGQEALDNCTGSHNTAIGDTAGSDLSTGDGNVYIGAGVGAGFGGGNESNHTYIRNINSTSVSGGGADYVTVDLETGLLGHLTSSRRHKEDIQPMDNASETLYRLKPVTYRYKKEIDPRQSLDYGLVAEDVAKVDPKLANRNRDGQIDSVRYNAINAMLLNEFLKEHKRVEEQQASIAELKSTVAQQQKAMEVITAQLKEQASQIKKVSGQIDKRKHVTEIARNP